MWPFSTIKHLRNLVELHEQYVLDSQQTIQQLQDQLAYQSKRPVHETFTDTGLPRFIMTGSVDQEEDQGVLMELNWNDAFVKSLQQSGVKGETDEMVVHRWLTSIAMSIAKDIETQDVEERGTQPLNLL